MNSYEREAIGDIVIVKGIVFENTAIGKKEPDHAWKDGRPCMIIYSDNELDYLLTLTSVDKDGSKQHFKINDENINDIIKKAGQILFNISLYLFKFIFSFVFYILVFLL